MGEILCIEDRRRNSVIEIDAAVLADPQQKKKLRKNIHSPLLYNLTLY